MITDKRHIKKQRSIACNDALEKIGDLKAFACVGNYNSLLSNSPKQRQREREREFESVRERESQRERVRERESQRERVREREVCLHMFLSVFLI